MNNLILNWSALEKIKKQELQRKVLSYNVSMNQKLLLRISEFWLFLVQMLHSQILIWFKPLAGLWCQRAYARLALQASHHFLPRIQPRLSVSAGRGRWFTGKFTWFHQGFPKFWCVWGRNERRPPKAGLMYYPGNSCPRSMALAQCPVKDPVAELGGGGFSQCWEGRLHFQP